MGEIVEDKETAAEKERGREREKVHFDSSKASAKKRYEIIQEFPFSSEVKRMTTIYHDDEHPENALILIKGAVSVVFNHTRLCLVSDRILQSERVLTASTRYIPDPEGAPHEYAPLTEEIRSTFLAKGEELASQGLRVIGLASRTVPLESVDNITREDAEQDFIFRGLAGIFDPPRPETVGAVRSCKQAGIVVHM